MVGVSNGLVTLTPRPELEEGDASCGATVFALVTLLLVLTMGPVAAVNGGRPGNDPLANAAATEAAAFRSEFRCNAVAVVAVVASEVALLVVLMLVTLLFSPLVVVLVVVFVDIVIPLLPIESFVVTDTQDLLFPIPIAVISLFRLSALSALPSPKPDDIPIMPGSVEPVTAAAAAAAAAAVISVRNSGWLPELGPFVL